MSDLPEQHAGAAALTLLESLIIHLQESGVIDADGRDAIYGDAIAAHQAVKRSDPAPTHEAVTKILHTLQTHADGVKLVGHNPAQR